MMANRSVNDLPRALGDSAAPATFLSSLSSLSGTPGTSAPYAIAGSTPPEKILHVPLYPVRSLWSRCAC